MTLRTIMELQFVKPTEEFMNTVKFEKGQVAVVAHRGLSGIEKENTIAAFVAAGNRSYFGIETDIYRTADGHFVISHDRNLDGLAGIDMDVENTTLAEIQKVVLYDTDGATKRIDLHPCTLEDYVRICKKYDKQCVLELKSAFTLEETEKFISIINEIGYLDRVTFISFNYDNLLKVRQILPNHHLQYLFYRP